MANIYVVGLGPGDDKQMTPQAKEAIARSGVVAGYKAYIELIRGKILGKRVIESGMTGEVSRCEQAVQAALDGNTVTMVCSGDAGIYGMASLIFEIAQGKDVSVEVVPGITAACSGAALLGAPLSHDFCVISLSDLLTDQEVIDKRIEAAAAADFCCAIYNPMSHKRRDKLARMCDIMLRYRDAQTVCGWVKNIGREGQQAVYTTLGELRGAQVDMFTTVFVGNSTTCLLDGRMVTPRGYDKKYSRQEKTEST